MRTYTTSIFITATLLFAGCRPESTTDNHHDGGHDDEIIFSKEQAALVGLSTETVSPGTFRQVIKTSGQILAAQGDETLIVATSNGIVSFVNPSIADGMAVRSGETVATVSAKKLLNGDPAVKAGIEYETALKEYQRAEKLVNSQIVSAKDFEQAKLRYETAKATYEAQASDQTANGVRVTSPVTGYIKNRLAAQGEYVSTGQPIAAVSQNRRLQLRADAPENYYPALKNISSAHFKPACDKAVYKLSDLNGRLLSFGKTSGGESFYIPVTFEFDNTGDFIPGAYTEVFLLANVREGVIAVPLSSVTEEQGLHFVYLQVEEEAYMKQEVTLGHDDGERVEILSGLKAGDQVVTEGVYQVKLAANSSVIPEGHSH
jgi:RND family efflux transporter MFP subunit